MRPPRLSLLCLALLLLVSASCGRGRDDAPEGTVTLTFWHSFVSSTQPALRELIRRFEAEHPGIRVREQYVPTGDGLVQKLLSAIWSRTAPDISWVHSDFLSEIAESGALYPMAEFVDGPNGLSEEEYADIFPALLQSASWRDTLYAMPMEATLLALFYNKDLFRQAGLDPERPPETWAELRAYTRALTRDHSGDGRVDRHGFYVPVFSAAGPYNVWMVLQWSPYLWQAGGRLIDPEQTAVEYDGAAGVEALTLWRDLHRDMGAPSYSLGHDLSFASQQIAMVMNGPWDLPRFRDLPFDWGIAPLPRGPVGEATYFDGEHLAIFRQSRHPEAAWTFVKWMLQPETQAFFSERSGYLPVRQSVLELPAYREYLARDPHLRAFVEQIPLGRSREPLHRHKVAINRHLAEAIERTIVGGADPQAALAEAAAKSNRLLQSGSTR